MEQYILGVRRYVLKEDPSTIPAARRNLNRIYYIGMLAQLLFLAGVIRLLVKHTRTFNDLWWNLISNVLQLADHVINWCPAHAGVDGNERADRVARGMTGRAAITPPKRSHPVRLEKCLRHNGSDDERLLHPSEAQPRAGKGPQTNTFPHLHRLHRDD
ncbi:hypothetical protein HPB50_028839 [Hyalomma asiaticum]|nr:hypothetical protein HPB50_028839 [Hyalomma asiaticum]